MLSHECGKKLIKLRDVLSLKGIDTFCFMILKLLYSGTFFLNWQYGLDVSEEWWESCPSLPAPTLGKSGTVTASCPQFWPSGNVTRGSEWRELELDCVGLTFPLFTPFVRGSCNRSVNQTSIINVKDTKHWHASYVWSFYKLGACTHDKLDFVRIKEVRYLIDDRHEQRNYIFQRGKRRTNTSNMAFYWGAVLKWHLKKESVNDKVSYLILQVGLQF
jgi:hypothetical protein